MTKCLGTSKLYTIDAHWKHYSIKIGSISFLSTSDMQKFHHLLGCHSVGINSSLIFYLSALRFLNLLCQAKNLVRIIVSESSSSKYYQD